MGAEVLKEVRLRLVDSPISSANELITFQLLEELPFSLDSRFLIGGAIIGLLDQW